MYGRGGVTTIVTGGITTGAGVATLPLTSGNTIGALIAYFAIGVGVIALTSQLVVRILRRYYRA